MTVTEEDRKLGLEIANQMEHVYVKRGHTRPNIAEAIAKGIALGRRQGIELAATRMESELAQLRAAISN